MFYFFDNVFYHISKVYHRTSEKSPEGTGIIVLSIVQIFNIFTITTLYSYYTSHKIELGKPLMILLYTALVVLNYIRYIYKDGHSYLVMSQEKEHLNGYFALIYILASIFSIIGLAIFLGGRH
jgi:hypothetical protein